MDKVTKAVLDSGTVVDNLNYVVGVSGGPDSLCLLDILMKLTKKKNITVIPVHVNHKLRENADAEQAHVEALCEGYGVKCNSFEVDCKALAEEHKVSTEEAGRVARYQIFNQVADFLVKQGANPQTVVIATAHNADDQSETVLHRILRGTSLHGLMGIRPIREGDGGYLIVRPLLNVPRTDIEAYVKRANLEPNIDEGNFEPTVTRNKIRLELIPYIEQNINPNVKETLRRLAQTAAIDDDYLEKIAGAVYESVCDEDTVREAFILHTNKMQNLHVAILRRVIANVLKDFGMEQDMTLRHISAVMEIMFGDDPSARIDLPGGIRCEREYMDLVFTVRDLNKPEDPGEDAIHQEMRLIPMILKASEYDRETTRLHAAFDYDRFCKAYPGGVSRIVVRNRQEGDYIVIAGGGRQKLQDFFVDSKVHRRLRDRLPVVAIDSEILWIPPHDSFTSKGQREKGKYSQNYQIDNKTRKVLFLELVRTV